MAAMARGRVYVSGVYNELLRMDQIVYQPENDADSTTNAFNLSNDHTRLLNLMMPLGYVLIPRAKLASFPTRRREAAPIASKIEHSKKPSFEEMKQSEASTFQEPLASTKVLNPEMEKCMRFLKCLKNHPKAEVFLYPVDTSIITDYLSYVEEPIDLSTIEYNIINGVYETFTQFMVDVKKIWFNAYSYNPKGSPIYLLTVEVDKYFDKLLRDDNIPVPNFVHPNPSRERQYVPPPPKPEPIKKKPNPAPYVSDVVLTMQEKRNLGSLIKKLPHEYLKGVWEIVSSGNNEGNQELQFDIETLPVRKARELEQYVKRSFSAIDAKNKQRDSFEHKVADQHASENESSFIIDSDSD